MALFEPPSRLLTAVEGHPETRRFSLGAGHWYSLQNHIEAILALPFNMNDYKMRYGDDSSGEFMDDCFTAMSNLRLVAKKYGSPRALRVALIKDPNLMTGPYMPEGSAYLQSIWMVNRAQQDALTLSTMLNTIPEVTAGVTPAEAISRIKAVFQADGQILDRMQTTWKNYDSLIENLRGHHGEMEDAQAAMETYTRKSSHTMLALNRELGGLTIRIEDLQRDRDRAYKLWLELTISAVAVAASIAVIGTALSIFLSGASAGSSAAIGGYVTAGASAAAGSALGIAAGLARSKYERLAGDLDDAKDREKKRIAYKHDLQALDSQMKFTLPTSDGVVNQFRGFRDGWRNTIEDIRDTLNTLDANTLSSGPWLDRSRMAGVAGKWATVDGAMSSFLQDALVDPELVAFGKPMPADDPAYKKMLTAA